MDDRDVAYEALHDTVMELMVEFQEHKHRVDLMEPLTPGRLPSAAEFDALRRFSELLHERVTYLEDKLIKKVI